MPLPCFGTTSALVDNTSYGNCTIRVTDTANNPSNALSVTSFTIDTTAPTLSSTSPADNERSIAITDSNWLTTTNLGGSDPIILYDYGVDQSSFPERKIDVKGNMTIKGVAAPD